MKEFGRAEWLLVHPEHFGHEQDQQHWKDVKFHLCARDGSRIVGRLDGFYMAGVMCVDQIMVAHDRRDEGIGQELMAKAEKIARENRLHKIHLETGTDWKAVKFYEKLGYGKEAKLRNHYEGTDFLVMSKFL